MRTAEQIGLYTAERFEQYQRNLQSCVNRFNDRVRLAKRLLAAAGEADLGELIEDEDPVPHVYKEPHADELAKVGPGSKVKVSKWEKSSDDDDSGHVCCRYLIVTHRSGDELCGFMADSTFFDNEEISFELKHVCRVEDERVGET